MDNYYDKFKLVMKHYKNDKVENKVKRESVLDYAPTWMEIVDCFQRFLIEDCGFTYLDDVTFSKVIEKARNKKALKKEKDGI